MRTLLTRSQQNVSVALCLLLSVLLTQKGAIADQSVVRPLMGAVVLARTSSSQALFIWDATPYVAQLRTDNISGDVALHDLEASALTALVAKSRAIAAREVSLRVTYAKTGAVNPVYGSPAFAGIESVLTLTARRDLLLKNASGWSTQLSDGKTPAGIVIIMSGILPPP